MIKMLPIFILLFTFWFLVPGTNAQNAQDCPIGKNATGLISAPFISGFEGIGVCNKDPSSAFAPYKIPTYDDLKSLYYTQSKASKNDLPNTTTLSITGPAVYYTANDLTIENLSGSGTAVIFVEKNLNILQDIKYGGANSGLVFVVRDNVYIDPSKVTRIDAVIISSGFIYTAATYPTTCTKNGVDSLQLTINGSLISLDSGKPIVFCRNLAVNNKPAELINHQVKYLVILRNLLSDTLQRWSEIQ